MLFRFHCFSYTLKTHTNKSVNKPWQPLQDKPGQDFARPTSILSYTIPTMYREAQLKKELTMFVMRNMTFLFAV